jgi:hypothetical protein
VGVPRVLRGGELPQLDGTSSQLRRPSLIRDQRDRPDQQEVIVMLTPSFGVEVSPIGVDDAEQIERGITAFACAPNGGLIVLAQPKTLVHRGSIIKFAIEHQLPAVYNSRLFTAGGGLISYGGDILDQYRRG